TPQTARRGYSGDRPTASNPLPSGSRPLVHQQTQHHRHTAFYAGSTKGTADLVLIRGGGPAFYRPLSPFYRSVAGLRPHRGDGAGAEHPAPARRDLRDRLPFGGLSIHRAHLQKDPAFLPGGGVGDRIGLLRILYQRLYHHPRRARVHHQDPVL